MDDFILTLGWVGVYAPAALGAIGSAMGVGRAGMAACGAMLEVESGYGRFIGVSALPSTSVIYGIVIMLSLSANGVTSENAPGVFGIGLLAGLALLLPSIAQGNACAASINASKSKPEIFGISIAPAAVVEGFMVFAFVFALLLVGSVPGMGG